jgi:membrane protein DedA with SNARE-associated domain
VPELNDIFENHQYLPYLILLVWTFLEGETIVIIAGVFARDGTPWLPLVILCSFCGSLASDQMLFFLGRYKGKGFIAKRPAWQQRAEKVYRMLEKHQYWLILGFRFMYGLRNITPFTLGMSQVGTRRFVILNVIGAAVWAVSFACGGYVFGAAMETFVEKHQKTAVLIALLIFMIILWIVRVVRRNRKAKSPEASPAERDNA